MPDMTGVMSGVGTATAIVQPLISMAYPILALIMLNKPVVKNYLAQFGK